MIRNISYKDKELNAEINELIGKPFGIFQVFKMGGVGSPRLRILEASKGFVPYLPRISNGEFCNLEIRPKGIFLRFRYNLDSMGWIVPYYRLSIFKSSDHYSLHAEGEFLKVKPAFQDVNFDKFIDKLQEFKANEEGGFPG